MSDQRGQLGAWGERVAATRLEAEGFQLLARNWRCRYGELDIIARQGEVLVFVEVRTRRGSDRGTPEESLTPRKAGQLLKLAQLYLGEHDLEVDWRIDLMAVELDRQGKLLRCDHIRNAVVAW